jgi:tetratricopeptide (TPR) repeat protein
MKRNLDSFLKFFPREKFAIKGKKFFNIEKDPEPEEYEKVIKELAAINKTYGQWIQCFNYLSQTYGADELNPLLLAGRRIFPQMAVFYVCAVHVKYEEGIGRMNESQIQTLSDEIEKGVELEPNNPEVFVLRAIFKHFEGDAIEKYNDLDRALTLDNKYAEAYYSRGLYYMLDSKIEQAVDDLEKAFEYGNKKQKKEAEHSLLQLKPN